MLQYYEDRIRRLERTGQQWEVAPAPADEFSRQLKVVPTCPPSTQVRVLSGQIYTNTTMWFWIYYDTQMPELIIDFANPRDSQMAWHSWPAFDWITFNFTNANYYVGLILRFDGEWVFYREYGQMDDPIWKCEPQCPEYATAAEAEQWIDRMLNGGYPELNDYSCPVWTFVLRNDGRTGIDGAVFPVDLVNRGRSYLYRDIRIRTRLIG